MTLITGIGADGLHTNICQYEKQINGSKIIGDIRLECLELLNKDNMGPAKWTQDIQ